jgi:hypothetical protein
VPKLSWLLASLALTILATNVHAEDYAFGNSGFTSNNNITVNSGSSVLNNTDSGWVNSLGEHNNGNQNYYSGCCDAGGSFDTFNYFSFSDTASGSVSSAEFNVFTYAIGVNGVYDIFATSLSPSTVYSGNSFISPAIYNALDGTLIGSIGLTPGDANSNVSINLNSAGDAWLQSNEGNGIVLGGEFVQHPPSPVPEPGGLLLLASGLGSMLSVLRRRLATAK